MVYPLIALESLLPSLMHNFTKPFCCFNGLSIPLRLRINFFRLIPRIPSVSFLPRYTRRRRLPPPNHALVQQLRHQLGVSSPKNQRTEQAAGHIGMFRATFHSVRCAVAPRLCLAPSLRSGPPSLSRAGIQYSRFPSSAKPRANTGDSSAVKTTSATNVSAVELHAAETSLAPLATSHASPQVESTSSAVASIAASTGQNTAARARCSHGIIRCAHVMFFYKCMLFFFPFSHHLTGTAPL